MRIPQRIRNIIFDMDDVLVLTRAIDRETKEKIFSPLNLRWSQILPYTHLSIKEMIPLIFRDQNIVDDPQKYEKLYFKKYNELLRKNTKKNIVPGVVNLIGKLYTKKYQLALVTSSTLEQAKIVCDQLHLKEVFKVIITADDVHHSKPHPEPYQKTIEKLNAVAEECAVVEDLPTGVISAKNADKNIFVIAITTTNPADNLKAADAVINSFEEIKF